MSRIGQKTGISKTEKKVIINAVKVPLVQANQNLNSGNRLVNGRNSFPSESDVGSRMPSSSFGSSIGDRKAIKLLRRKIPNP